MPGIAGEGVLGGCPAEGDCGWSSSWLKRKHGRMEWVEDKEHLKGKQERLARVKGRENVIGSSSIRVLGERLIG